LALTARSEQTRDQFFPGYRSDAVSVGVQGRWTLFAGGRVQAARSEASAARRVAEAQRDSARAALKAQVINAWSDLQAMRLAVEAAKDQSGAATSAVDSLGNEVRVGQRPMVDLLDAQRDLLAATARRLAAEGDLVVAARRVAVLTGSTTGQSQGR
jgi:outer membrane protein TolC